jgi:hypothetical protein
MKTPHSKQRIGVQKSFWDMNKEEKEAALAKATKQARDDLHAEGKPYHVGDARGTYAIYPDGKRVFFPNKPKNEDG